MGDGTVPVRYQSAGVECESVELPGEILHQAHFGDGLGRPYPGEEVSFSVFLSPDIYNIQLHPGHWTFLL